MIGKLLCLKTTKLLVKCLLYLGSPEFIVFNAVPANDGIAVGDLNQKVGDMAKIGLGQCMKNKWLKKDGDKVVRVMDEVKDETAEILWNVDCGVAVPEKTLQDLKKRKRTTWGTGRKAAARKAKRAAA